MFTLARVRFYSGLAMMENGLKEMKPGSQASHITGLI